MFTLRFFIDAAKETETMMCFLYFFGETAIKKVELIL